MRELDIDRLKYLMRLMNMDRKQVAAELDVSPSLINKVMGKHQKCSHKLNEKIKYILRRSLEAEKNKHLGIIGQIDDSILRFT